MKPPRTPALELDEKVEAKADKKVEAKTDKKIEAKTDEKIEAKADKTIEAKGQKSTAVLLDTDGKVGRQYSAKRTPEMYVIGKDGATVYHGAIDSVRSANAADIEGATNYVSEVLDAVIAGKASPHSKTKAYGCSVKYAGGKGKKKKKKADN